MTSSTGPVRPQGLAGDIGDRPTAPMVGPDLGRRRSRAAEELLAQGAAASAENAANRAQEAEQDPGVPDKSREQALLDGELSTDEANEAIDELFAEADDPAGYPGDEKQQALAQAADRRQAVQQGMADELERDARSPEPVLPEEAVFRAKTRHDHYTQLMMLNCLKPLSKGAGPDELLETVTSLAVLWALNPRFRELTAQYSDTLNRTLRTDVINLKRRKGSTSVAAGEAEKARAAEQAAAAERGHRRLTKAALDAADGSSPFVAEEAALHLVAAEDRAFHTMRMGTDREEARAGADRTRQLWSQQWSAQGLDPAEINTAVHQEVARRGAADDTVLARYSDTAWGHIRPGRVDKDGSWDGSLVTSTGGSFDVGKLDPSRARNPIDPMAHAQMISMMIQTDLDRAAKKGPAQLHEALCGYQNALEVSDLALLPASGGTPRHDSVACAARGRVALQAMAIDGIGPDYRKAAITNALEHAKNASEQELPKQWEAFGKKYPEGVGEKASQKFVAFCQRTGRPSPVRTVSGVRNASLQAWMESSGVPSMPMPDAREDPGPEPGASVLDGFGPRRHPDREPPQAEADQPAGPTGPEPVREPRAEEPAAGRRETRSRGLPGGVVPSRKERHRAPGQAPEQTPEPASRPVPQAPWDRITGTHFDPPDRHRGDSGQDLVP